MTPEQAVTSLVLTGAVLTPTLGGVPMPVGLMVRLNGRRWFWFAAGGETEFDAHVIECDAVKVWHDGAAVEFSVAGEAPFRGYLTTPEETYDDEESAAAARATIAEWKARYAKDATLRGFIERRKYSM